MTITKRKLLVSVAAVWALSCASMAVASDTKFEITYLALSQHIESGIDSTTDYNANHNFIGLEYRAGKHGYAVASFRNSFYEQSYLIDYARYWKWSANVELSARIGAVTGYEHHQDYCGKVCLFSSVGVAYTANKNFIPKLSFAPGVFVLSFSIRF